MNVNEEKEQKCAEKMNWRKNKITYSSDAVHIFTTKWHSDAAFFLRAHKILHIILNVN